MGPDAVPGRLGQGWAEYQANLAMIHDDPTYDLSQRIDMLLDDDYWAGSAQSRRFWEWQLLVEYLGEVKGYRLTDLGRADVKRFRTWQQMIAWHRAR